MTKSPQARPSFGRTHSASLRIASSASGACPAEKWKTCCTSGNRSSLTSTPAFLARSASRRLSSNSASSPPLDVDRRQTLEVCVERVRQWVLAIAAVAQEGRGHHLDDFLLDDRIL